MTIVKCNNNYCEYWDDAIESCCLVKITINALTCEDYELAHDRKEFEIQEAITKLQLYGYKVTKFGSD